jgi:hypothetical protein
MAINDWLKWHQHYDNPDSPLVQRLMATQAGLRQALAEAPANTDGVVQLVSICAGEGRDVLPVLAGGAEGRRVKALLLENDAAIAEGGRANIAKLGLADVEMRVADAGTIDSFADMLPAHVVVASGVFGNISMADAKRTAAALRTVVAPGGLVVWTRSRRLNGPDRSLALRAIFLDHRFSELSFITTPDGTFRIGLYKRPAETETFELPASRRMFEFNSSATSSGSQQPALGGSKNRSK